MFNLPNKAGSEAVLYFLFNRLNPSLCKEQFRYVEYVYLCLVHFFILCKTISFVLSLYVIDYENSDCSVNIINTLACSVTMKK